MRKNRVVIYGAGECGRRILDFFIFIKESRNICFCDGNKELIGQNINGIEIKEFQELNIEDCLFFTGGKFAEEIVEYLLERKVDKNCIFIYNPNVRMIGNYGGGFYLPKEIFCRGRQGHKIIYSVGIGENISFDEEILKVINADLYAFDPTPKAIDYINRNDINKKENFHFYSYGLSDKNGEEKFYLPKNKSHVSASIVLYDGIDKDDSIIVTMKRLDTVISELKHKHINILKMDVEGAEFRIFEDFFSRKKGNDSFDYLCIELHERFFEEPKTIREGFIRLLKENGYYYWYSLGEEFLFVSSKVMQTQKMNPFVPVG